MSTAAQRASLPLIEVARCPICSSSRQNILAVHGSKRLHECRQCGVCFLFPQPSAAVVASHFREPSAATAAQLERDYETSRKDVLARVAREIKKRQRPGRILDVGCATGYFLREVFLNVGWQGEAVELSPANAAVASQRGLLVHGGDVHEARLDSASFDVVTVLDAFYYFGEPQRDLGEIRRILNDNGLLAIELAWARSRIWRRSGTIGRWLSETGLPLLESSDHLFYYTPKSARYLLEDCGFEVEAIIALPGNHQETVAAEVLCRAYSCLSQMAAALSNSRVCLGPRFLVLARKYLGGTPRLRVASRKAGWRP